MLLVVNQPALLEESRELIARPVDIADGNDAVAGLCPDRGNEHGSSNNDRREEPGLAERQGRSLTHRGR